MKNKSKELLADALKLPVHSRARIAEKLLASLDDEEVLDAAIEEAERRWCDFKAGKRKPLPLEEVFPELAKLRQRNGKR